MEHVYVVHYSSYVSIHVFELLWSCTNNAPSPFYPSSDHPNA
jgi:hypothetical protein